MEKMDALASLSFHDLDYNLVLSVLTELMDALVSLLSHGLDYSLGLLELSQN